MNMGEVYGGFIIEADGIGGRMMEVMEGSCADFRWVRLANVCGS
jgi:hypothetical protein